MSHSMIETAFPGFVSNTESSYIWKKQSTQFGGKTCNCNICIIVYGACFCNSVKYGVVILNADTLLGSNHVVL